MNHHKSHLLMILLAILAIPSIILGQQLKTKALHRGIQGVRPGHTVKAVKQAYGNEYGNLVQKFYDSAGNVGNPANAPTSYVSNQTPGPSDPDSQQHSGQVNNQQNLSVMIDVVKEVCFNDRCRAAPVVNDDVLTQQDHYKIIIKSNVNCYLYVVQLDSTGKIDPLFPSRFSPYKNPVKQDMLYEVPRGSKWFFLDSNTGVETLYFIASRTRRYDIEQVLEELQKRNSTLVRKRKIPMNTSTVMTRGIKGVRPGKTQKVSLMSGDKSTYTSTIIQSVQADFVMTRYFNHR